MRLKVPDGYVATYASNPAHAEGIDAFIRRSPDRTLYHLPPYFNFWRAQSQRFRDLLLLSRDGVALVAVPLQVEMNSAMLTSWTGALFPPASTERGLRRSVSALTALLDANPHHIFEIIQSAQAPAYATSQRPTLLARLLESEGLPLESLYGRLLTLDEATAEQVGQVALGRAHDLRPDVLENPALARYDPDVRNQIRQAIKKRVTVAAFLVDDDRARAAVYTRFAVLHQESWTRTGLEPHTFEYLLDLSRVIESSGGQDLVVVASDERGHDVAAVNCHLYEGRAIYWAGASTQDGLRLRANPLCLHAAISVAAATGAQVLELGRFRPMEPAAKELSITKYKAQFGGEIVRLTSFRSRPRALAALRKDVTALALRPQQYAELWRRRQAERSAR